MPIQGQIQKKQEIAQTARVLHPNKPGTARKDAAYQKQIQKSAQPKVEVPQQRSIITLPRTHRHRSQPQKLSSKHLISTKNHPLQSQVQTHRSRKGFPHPQSSPQEEDSSCQTALWLGQAEQRMIYYLLCFCNQCRMFGHLKLIIFIKRLQAFKSHGLQ